MPGSHGVPSFGSLRVARERLTENGWQLHLGFHDLHQEFAGLFGPAQAGFGLLSPGNRIHNEVPDGWSERLKKFLQSPGRFQYTLEFGRNRRDSCLRVRLELKLRERARRCVSAFLHLLVDDQDVPAIAGW